MGLLSTQPVPIAIVLRALDAGGTEHQMIELARRLDPSRWSVHVACFRADGPWHGRVAARVKVCEFPVRSFRDPRTLSHLARFARWCRAERIQVVHTATLSGNVFGLAGAALAGVPARIGSQRGYDVDRSAVERRLQRLAYGGAHRIVANSHALPDLVVDQGVPRHRVTIVPNGVEPVTTPRVSVRAVRRIAMVGTLRAVKGHDVLVDAAPSVLARHPDVHFDIVGGGPRMDELRARAEARGVASAFTFRGHCDDVAARIESADAVVLPSRSEGLPNALLEPMAQGRPVVARRVGGMPDVVEAGVNGLLVPPGDAAALADAIAGLITDRRAADRLGLAARNTIERRFGFDRMVDACERLYDEVLARRRPAAALDRAGLAETSRP